MFTEKNLEKINFGILNKEETIEKIKKSEITIEGNGTSDFSLTEDGKTFFVKNGSYWEYYVFDKKGKIKMLENSEGYKNFY